MQLLIDLWCLFWLLGLHAGKTRKEKNWEGCWMPQAGKTIKGKGWEGHNAHRQTRTHMHFLWHDGFFKCLSYIGCPVYGVMDICYFLESHWRWSKMALMRLGRTSRSWSTTRTREHTISRSRLRSSLEKIRPSISISFCFMQIFLGLECSCFFDSHVSWSCVCFVCSFVCIFSEANALIDGQIAGRAAAAEFRQKYKARIEKAKANNRLPDSKFGFIWSSARYICVESYVHLLVLMTLWFLCASSDSYSIFHHPCGRPWCTQELAHSARGHASLCVCEDINWIYQKLFSYASHVGLTNISNLMFLAWFFVNLLSFIFVLIPDRITKACGSTRLCWWGSALYRCALWENMLQLLAARLGKDRVLMSRTWACDESYGS